jgi:hypothetical protein
MRLNRITKYLPAQASSKQPEPATGSSADLRSQDAAPLAPSAFAALPAFALPMFGAPTASPANAAAMNLYTIALKDAQRQVAQKKSGESGSAEMELGDL